MRGVAVGKFFWALATTTGRLRLTVLTTRGTLTSTTAT